MSFLSISMDVVGSTALKRRLTEFSSLNKTNLDEHYRDMLRSMLVSMNCFLDLVSLDPLLDIHRLVLIKRIGDEFWYMYDLDGLEEAEIPKHSTQIAKALLAFLLDAHFDVTAFLPDAHIREELFWKCTVDLINHAVDSSKLAEDELDQFIMKFMDGQPREARIQNRAVAEREASLELRNKLGLGLGYLSGNNVVYVARPDFIGLEIDLFFRISRHAEKGKILAGQKFLSLLLINACPTSEKYLFGDSSECTGTVLALPEFAVELLTFSATKLKGIKGGYSGAYIFNEYQERADYEGFWNLKN